MFLGECWDRKYGTGILTVIGCLSPSFTLHAIIRIFQKTHCVIIIIIGMHDSIKQALYDTGDNSLQTETGDANNSPTTNSHITRSSQSWHMNETEASSEEGPLNYSSENFLEGSESKSLKVGKNCPLKVPIFKMLEISKINYSWKNITQQSGERILACEF